MNGLSLVKVESPLVGAGGAGVLGLPAVTRGDIEMTPTTGNEKGAVLITGSSGGSRRGSLWRSRSESTPQRNERVISEIRKLPGVIRALPTPLIPSLPGARTIEQRRGDETA